MFIKALKKLLALTRGSHQSVCGTSLWSDGQSRRAFLVLASSAPIPPSFGNSTLNFLCNHPTANSYQDFLPVWVFNLGLTIESTVNFFFFTIFVLKLSQNTHTIKFTRVQFIDMQRIYRNGQPSPISNSRSILSSPKENLYPLADVPHSLPPSALSNH